MKIKHLTIPLLLLCTQGNALSVRDYQFKRFNDLKRNPPIVPYSSLTANEKYVTSSIIEALENYVIKCDGRTFARFDRETISEIKDAKYIMFFSSDKVSPASKLNGITWNGIIHARHEGSAYRKFENGRWARWESYLDSSYIAFNLPAKIENGEILYDSSASDFVYGSPTKIQDKYKISCDTIHKIVSN